MENKHEANAELGGPKKPHARGPARGSLGGGRGNLGSPRSVHV